MYSNSHHESPFNALPVSVVLLTLAIAIPELIFQLAENGLLAGVAPDLRHEMIFKFGFFGQRWAQSLQLGRIPDLYILVTYPFVSGAFLSTVLGAVFTLVFGKTVAERFGNTETYAIFFLTAALGAIGYFLLFGQSAAIISGYAPAWGLLGAFTWIQYQELKKRGLPLYMAFRLFIMLALFDLFFLSTGMNSWSFLADWFAFATGFGLSFLIGPGSAARIRRWRDQMRQR